MPNPLEVRARMRSLAAEAHDLVGSKTISTARKSARMRAIETEIKTLGETADVHRRASELAVGGSALGSTHEDVGQRGWVGKGGPSLTLTADQQRALFSGVQDRTPVSIKTAVGTGNVDPATYPAQFLPPVLAAREPTRIADLLPSSGTAAGVLQYYVTSGTAAAAATAEGAEKPQSSIAYTKVTVEATKIAHYVEVTSEALSDFSAFTQLLSGDMVAGVVDAEYRELLSATGTSPSSFKGMLVVTGTQAYVRGTEDADETMLDALEIGGTGLRAAGRFVQPDGIILNPLDYSKARRTKTTTGAYATGADSFGADAPLIAGSDPRLWGLPVRLTSQIAQGTAIVGNFANAAMVWIREGITVRVNPNGVGFRSNVVEVIAEERLMLGVLAPSALSVVTISAPA